MATKPGIEWGVEVAVSIAGVGECDILRSGRDGEQGDCLPLRMLSALAEEMVWGAIFLVLLCYKMSTHFMQDKSNHSKPIFRGIPSSLILAYGLRHCHLGFNYLASTRGNCGVKRSFTTIDNTNALLSSVGH